MHNISLFKKIKQAKIIKEPFVHVCIENALDDEVYQNLKKNFPNQSLFTDKKKSKIFNNQRFDIYNDNFEKLKNLNITISNFINYHSSIQFWNEIQELFGHEILKINNKHFESLDDLKALKIRKYREESGKKDLFLHCSVSINTAVNHENSVRSIHLDNLNKMYAGLYYLRDDEDDSDGGNLLLYKWNKYLSEREKIKIIEQDNFKNHCEIFNEIQYRPNTFIFFLNNLDALHGVSMRGITKFSRNFFYLSGIYGTNLFNINQYKLSLLNKMQLKFKKVLFDK